MLTLYFNKNAEQFYHVISHKYIMTKGALSEFIMHLYIINVFLIYRCINTMNFLKIILTL